MRTLIYKYELGANIRHDFHYYIRAPKGGKILSIQVQGNTVVCWIEFDVINLHTLEDIELYVAYTGNSFELDRELKLTYITTLQHDLVYHIYRVEQ